MKSRRTTANEVAIRAFCLIGGIELLLGASRLLAAQPPGDAGYTVLKQYCYRCHGTEFKVPEFNVLDRGKLIAPRGPDELPYVTPGKPDKSFIWQRVSVDGDMPPRAPKPTGAEKETLKQWILAGAPFPERPTRPFKSETDVLTVIRDHLRRTGPANRKFQRFFTLTHLYNNHRQVTADELRLYQAALSKVINSLSWKREIVLLQPLDAERTVFALDLRDVGWEDPRLWQEVVRVYPYGLKHSEDADAIKRALAVEVYRLSGSDLPMLRADWLIATASRPPLYHILLDLPKNSADLERQLRVDFEDNFLNDRMARAAFATSGVSGQNRLVERHSAVYGAYWKSYDFRANAAKGNLFQFPLGPEFHDNPFPRQAFTHAGGELIFNLPNGLQGYLLVTAKGDRIDEGPVEIVNDSLRTSGTPAIVNGLSCMACHRHGMIRFKDTLRAGTGVDGAARLKVERLFPEQAALDRLVQQDEDRFVRALEEAIGGLLRTNEDRGKDIREFPEPIGAIARLYVKDLTPEEVSLELGIADVEDLRNRIRANPKLRHLGLGPLVEGATIKREAWESSKKLLSVFQEAARELELGTPFRVF